MKKIYTMLLLSAAAAACVGSVAAASNEAKAVYREAEDQAGVNYKAARARCDAITGNPKDVCVAEAKAERVHAEADATAQYKNTLGAFTKARTQIAEANYDVDKTRCAARTGNDKDVCVKQAKSTRVAALADAKADKKVIEARSNAREDKRIAEYKVVTEKCDALAGAAKDNCVKAAKSQFGY
ncbi:MAG TPA: hypothetical protein DCW29_23470 [Janthinobacterium sp.]|nr:hypothetical protein [Janthinobacterium sp.]